MIEMPKKFRDIYKYREGTDRFFFDKIKELVDVVNALNVEEATVAITVKDNNSDAVAGAKVKLTSGTTVLTSNETGSAGGATLSKVPYGKYSVAVIAPTGYTASATYSDLNVNSDSVSLTVQVTKNS